MSAEIFVTPHARTMFRERIRDVPDDRAARLIEDALRSPLFRLDSSADPLTLWGCMSGRTPFVAATDPADEGAPYLLVRTVAPRHYYRETRPLWGQAWKNGKGHRAIETVRAQAIQETQPQPYLDPRLAGAAERYRAAEAAAVPLAVVLTLRPGSPLAGYDPLALDGLLARCVVEDAVPEGRLADRKPGYVLPVPLRRLGEYGAYRLPLWAATLFHPAPGEASVEDIHYWHKRAQGGMWTGTKSGEFSIKPTAGRWMERRVPLPARQCRRWLAMAMGDPEEIARLLARIAHVGKRRGNGFGEVEKWAVEPLPEFHLLSGDSRPVLLRSLPVDALELVDNRVPAGDAAPCSWTPPGWNTAFYLPGWWPGTPLPAYVERDWFAEAEKLC